MFPNYLFIDSSDTLLLLFSPLLVRVSLIDSFTGNGYPLQPLAIT